MAGRISDADKERVRDANRIEQVVAEYVALKPAGGGNLKGLCPFHDEKTASFNVRPSHGSYHCFGCGEGGDVFSFVAAIEHLSFVEAVERLAERVGIVLQRVEGGSGPRVEPGTRSRLLAVNKAAAAFYAEQLAADEAEPARAFLAERGFDLTAALRFGCGYAPGGWDRLTKTLIRQGFSADELEKAGVSRRGQRGMIDRFHRRLLWSITDAAGDVVGFGARRLFDDDPIEAKYVNTQETVLFKKSQLLYGLNLAKREIAKQRTAVVVEGYTDVMAMHLAGVTTAVASCGTAFGDEHISVLRRYLMDSELMRGKVVYTFDGDAAGQKAALKAFESDQKFASETFVAIAPDGMDPCELRQAKGDAAVRGLVDRRTPLFAFAVDSTLAQFDLEQPEGRVGATRAVTPLLAQIKNPDLRAQYVNKYAGWLGVAESDLAGKVREAARILLARQRERERPVAPLRGQPAAEQANGTARPGGAAVGQRAAVGNASGGASAGAGATPVAAGQATATAVQAPQVRRPDPRDPRSAVEREVLKLVLQQPDLVAADYPSIPVTVFSDPAYGALHEAVLAAGGPGDAPPGPAWMGVVSERLAPGVLRSLVSELAVEPPHQRNGQPTAEYAGRVLAAMAERAAAAEERRLGSALQRASAQGDRERAAALQADLFSMTAYRRALAQRARGED